MAMSCSSPPRRSWPILAAGLAYLALAGCATQATDAGQAIHANVAAQRANPLPPPAPVAVSDGARVAGAQERYRTGRVIAPSDAGASKVGLAGAPQ